jgi:hypothetical protein
VLHPRARRAARAKGTATAVTVVTTAGRSHSDDIVLRQRRYLAMQSLRVVCLLLAATVPGGLAVKGVFLVGAVVLPYFGVVMANAGPARDRRRPAVQEKALDQPAQPRLQIQPGRVVDAE